MKKYLRSADAEVVGACKALSLDPMHVLVADIPLDEYMALVTAFYSVLDVQKPEELINGTQSFRINTEEFLARTKIPRDHFDLFLHDGNLL